MEDVFDILAAKVLAGEATEAERSQLQSMLARSDELRAEFAALQSTWNSLKEAAPVIQAQTAPSAEIPAGRLRQLQQAVRDSPLAAASASGKRVSPHNQAEESASLSLVAIIRHWLQQWSGDSQGLVSVALLRGVAGVFIWLNQPEAGRIVESPSTDPVAHLLVNQGRVEVRRRGQLLTAVAAFTLRAGDQIQLPSESEATVIAPDGDVRLRGPRTTTALDLAAEVRASNRLTNQPGQASALQLALFQPVPELLKSGLLVTTRSAQSIPLYSPNGATASMTPLILWKAEPGKTYDLQITDEFDSATPPWTVSAATPPVEFAKVEAWKGRTLARDGLYRLRISETGRPLTTCEYTFRTMKDGGAPSLGATTNPLHEVLRILTTAPSCVGDALAILLTLPPELAESELSLRLKLMVFGQLGQQDDFDGVISDFQPVP